MPDFSRTDLTNIHFSSSRTELRTHRRRREFLEVFLQPSERWGLLDAIEYYSCFISYSSKDDEFARRLYDGLQGKNIRTWFAPEDLKIGSRFRTEIDESIRLHDKLVLILSEHSINSAWVRREVEAALEREDRDKKEILFPIRVDDSVFATNESWATEVRRRHIGDFRNWKSHDDYTKSFDRLVRDLKREGPIVMKS